MVFSISSNLAFASMTQALDSPDVPAFDFSFDISHPEGLSLSGVFDVCPGDDAQLLRRLCHYARWVTQNRTRYQFEYFAFESVNGQPAVSRTVQLQPQTADIVYVSCGALKPISEAIFDNRLDQRLLNSLNDVVLVSEAEPINRPGPRVVYVNGAFEKMTGYSPADVIGQSPRILQHPDTDKEALKVIRLALEAWEPVTQILLNRTKEGVPFYVELSINPVTDDTGWYIYWIAVQRDVTHQYIDTTNRQRMLEAAPEATVCIDANSVITYFSDKAEKLWEMQRTEVIGEPLDVLIPEEARSAHRNYVAQHRAQKTTPTCTLVKLKTQSGRIRNCRMHIAKTELYDGSIGYTIFARDHSEELKKEQELEQARKSNLVQSRLASLGEMAAGIGHEINNPLQLILGQLDLASIKNKDTLDASPDLSSTIENVKDACLRIRDIVASLRGMSRVGDDVDPSHVEEVSLICMQTVQMLKQISPQKNLDIRLELPAEPVFARIDAVSLNQILVNLVNNAADAMEGSDVQRVTIKVDKDSEQCVISVADTGPGIPEEHQAKVFHPFFTTKDVGKGTGLGLSIINNIVSSFGGTIGFSSAVGKGTTFTVALLSPTNGEIAAAAPEDKTLRILLVDDEPGIINFLQAYLVHGGHTVVTAQSAADALDRFAKEAFDVVISDYQMPVVTGDEMLKQMREMKSDTEFKAILISGYLKLEQGFSSKAPRLYNADATLQKPFTLEQLEQTLKKLCYQK